jgi:hypothetical protein
LYCKGTFTSCNYTLTWQNSSGAILSYPSIKETTNTVGIDQGTVISTGNSVVSIKLPFDSETKLLDVDKRVFIDDLSVDIPQVYSISKPDRTTYKCGDKGIIKLTMKQDEYNNDTDNKELGICNYYDIPTPPPVGDGYSVILASGELCIGATRKLSVKFYETDGTENTTITADWNVILPIGLESYFDVTISGNICAISVNDDDYATIDTTVEVTTSNGANGYIGNTSMTVNA